MIKELRTLVPVLTAAVILAVSCSGGNGGTKGEDGVLKELPAMAAEAMEEQTRMQSEVEKHLTDNIFEKAIAAEEKMKAAKKEKFEKMKALVDANKMDIDFKQSDDLKSIDVKGVKLTGIAWNPKSYPHINLHISFKAKEQLKSSQAFLIDYLDKDGNIVKSGKGYTGFGKKPKAGDSGVIYANPKLDNMGKFSSIIIKEAAAK